MTQFKKNPIREVLQTIGKVCVVFFKTLWNVLKDVFEIIFKAIQTVFSAWVHISIGVCIVLVSCVLSVFLIAESIGLDKSAPFQLYRDEFLANMFGYVSDNEIIREQDGERCSSSFDCQLPLSMSLRGYKGKCIQHQCVIIRNGSE